MTMDWTSLPTGRDQLPRCPKPRRDIVRKPLAEVLHAFHDRPPGRGAAGDCPQSPLRKSPAALLTLSRVEPADDSPLEILND